MDSVRHYRKDITDGKLKAQVAGFIGQEAMHSKEHEAWNEMGVKFGYPTDKLDKSLGKLLGLVQKRTPKIFQLAATVCLEHYTAIIAEQLLNHLGRGRFTGYSAGSRPTGRVNPNAVQALERRGVARSKVPVCFQLLGELLIELC